MSASVRDPAAPVVERDDPGARAEPSATLLAWLDARTPTPPVSLAARLRAILAERGAERRAAGAPDQPEEPIADALVATAEWLLARLLGDGGLTRRSAALDLLAADALVTYAFEAASDDPERLEERAARAMASLAALVV